MDEHNFLSELKNLNLYVYCASNITVREDIFESSPEVSPLPPPANLSVQESKNMLRPARKWQEMLLDKRHEQLYRDVRT